VTSHIDKERIDSPSFSIKPNISFYRKKAKELYKGFKEEKLWALEKFKKHLFLDNLPLSSTVKLSSAHTVIARENGYSNWQLFKTYISDQNESYKKDYLKKLRLSYAKAICMWNNVTSRSIRKAFGKIPREQFEGEAPWNILDGFGYWAPNFYKETKLSNIYKNVHIAKKEAKLLNNGIPSTQADWINAVHLQKNEKILHIGCGSGYYTAILCELVGKNGEVTFYDQDAELGELAVNNLRNIPQANFSINPDILFCTKTFDVIYINSGSPCIHQHWLNSLNENGRLLVSLTASYWGFKVPYGETILITRKGSSFHAKFLSNKNALLGSYYQDYGSRDMLIDEELKTSYKDKSYKSVRSLRTDSHDKIDTCWAHLGEVCFSKQTNC
jgi:protein-L-isoaspartate(D-aspartate) O-methyltransferase